MEMHFFFSGTFFNFEYMPCAKLGQVVGLFRCTAGAQFGADVEADPGVSRQTGKGRRVPFVARLVMDLCQSA